MRVTVNMTTTEEKFYVDDWFANSPEFVLASIIKQLKAAAAVWPALEEVTVTIPKSLIKSET